MAKRNQTPARTVEGRQNQLINLAVEEAERRLKNGTASSQIITTLLKWASTKAELELEKLRTDIQLSKAKEKEIEEKSTSSKIYEEALEAFRSYKPSNDDYEEDGYYEE